MKKFKLIASIIGPYLPRNVLKVGKFTIDRLETPPKSNIPTKPSVSLEGEALSKDEALVVLDLETTFYTTYYVHWNTEAESSKLASESGKAALDFFLSCLSLPASSYKYFAKIIKIDHVNEEDTGPDSESPTSDPIHILSYKPADIKDTKFYEALLSSEDKEIRDLVNKFYDGVKSEILSQGDSNLKYYKLLEEISSKTLKRLREVEIESGPNYSKILIEIGKSLNLDLKDKEKAKKIKEYANKLRALDYEQIGERIILTAHKFNLGTEVIETLKRVNKYRSRVLVHGTHANSETKLEDHKDVREMARLFLLHFLHKFYGIAHPNLSPVRENDSWYKYSYSRSDTKK